MASAQEAHQSAAVHTGAQEEVNLTHTRGGIMANEEHLRRLREGIDAWNQWRQEYEDERIDLVFADLTGINLRGANLQGASLRGARLENASRDPDTSSQR